MNNESSYFISSYVAAGNNNRNEPIIIIKIKLRIKIFAGCCFVIRYIFSIQWLIVLKNTINIKNNL